MIFAELLVLLSILGASGVGLSAIVTWNQQRSQQLRSKQRFDEERIETRTKALEEALKTRDHSKLDDWLILHGDEVSADLRRHIEARRDELFIAANP